MREFEEIKKFLLPLMKETDVVKANNLITKINIKLFCHLQLSSKQVENIEEKNKQLVIIANAIISKIVQLYDDAKTNEDLFSSASSYIILMYKFGFDFKKVINDKLQKYLTEKSKQTPNEKAKLQKRFTSLSDQFDLHSEISLYEHKDKLFKLAAKSYGIEGINNLTSLFEKKHLRKDFWSKLLFDLVSPSKFSKDKKIRFTKNNETLSDVVNFIIPNADLDRFFNIGSTKVRLKDVLILKNCLKEHSRNEFTADQVIKNHLLLEDGLLAEILSQRGEIPSVKLVFELYKDLIGTLKLKTLEYILSDKTFVEAFKSMPFTEVVVDQKTFSVNKFEYIFNLFHNEPTIIFEHFMQVIKLFISKECFAKEKTIIFFMLYLANNIKLEDKIELLATFIENGFDLFHKHENHIGILNFLIRNKEYAFIEQLFSNPKVLKVDPNIINRFYSFTAEQYPLALARFRNQLFGHIKVDLSEIKTFFLFLISANDSDLNLIKWAIQLAKKNNISLDLEIDYPIVMNGQTEWLKNCGIKRHTNGKIITMTPLSFASTIGKLEIVKILHAAGASVNSVNGSPPALFFAAMSGKIEIVEYFLLNAKNLTLEFNKEGFSPVFDALLLRLWDGQREQFKLKKNYTPATYFKEGKKERYISKLLSLPAFQHAKISEKTLATLICDQLYDFELFKKLYQDDFLESTHITSAIRQSTHHEPFVIDALNFIVSKLKVYKIKESTYENINFLLANCAAYLYFTKSKVAFRSDKETQQIRKKVGMVSANSPSHDHSHYCPVPNQDNRKYLLLVQQLLSIIEEQQVKVNWQYPCLNIPTLQWLCLSDYKDILLSALALTELNQVELFTLSKQASSLNCENSLEVILNYLENKTLVLKCLKIAIEHNNLELCKKILSKLRSLNDKLTNDDIVKLFSYTKKSQDTIVTWLNTEFTNNEVVKLPDDNQQNLAAISEQEFKSIFGTTAFYDNKNYSYFKFFDTNKNLKYAQVENAHLKGIETLEAQLARILSENNQDLQLANKKIVRVNNPSKYGDAEYKIRFFGNISDKRLLLFKQASKEQNQEKEEKQTQEPTLYISKLAAKHS